MHRVTHTYKLIRPRIPTVSGVLRSYAAKVENDAETSGVEVSDTHTPTRPNNAPTDEVEARRRSGLTPHTSRRIFKFSFGSSVFGASGSYKGTRRHEHDDKGHDE